MFEALRSLFGGGKEHFKRSLKLETFMEGKTIPLKDVPDQVFSRQILGKGVAIEPEGDLLLAPADGTVAALMERTRHSCCIRTKEGVELLLHIGVNTVEMNGEGFELLVARNQEVQAGQPLIRFSPEKIRQAGFPLVSSMVITEDAGFHKASFVTGQDMKKGDRIAELYG